MALEERLLEEEMQVLILFFPLTLGHNTVLNQRERLTSQVQALGSQLEQGAAEVKSIDR